MVHEHQSHKIRMKIKNSRNKKGSEKICYDRNERCRCYAEWPKHKFYSRTKSVLKYCVCYKADAWTLYYSKDVQTRQNDFVQLPVAVARSPE